MAPAPAPGGSAADARGAARVARERLRARGGEAAERERTLVFFAAMKLMRYEKKPMAPERTTEGGPEGAFLRKPCSPHAEDVGRRGARACAARGRRDLGRARVGRADAVAHAGRLNEEQVRVSILMPLFMSVPA